MRYFFQQQGDKSNRKRYLPSDKDRQGSPVSKRMALSPDRGEKHADRQHSSFPVTRCDNRSYFRVILCSDDLISLSFHRYRLTSVFKFQRGSWSEWREQLWSKICGKLTSLLAVKVVTMTTQVLCCPSGLSAVLCSWGHTEPGHFPRLFSLWMYAHFNNTVIFLKYKDLIFIQLRLYITHSLTFFSVTTLFSKSLNIFFFSVNFTLIRKFEINCTVCVFVGFTAHIFFCYWLVGFAKLHMWF